MAGNSNSGNWSKIDHFWFNELVKKSFRHIHDNYNRFSESNQIRVWQGCVNKIIPTKIETKIEGELTHKIASLVEDVNNLAGENRVNQHMEN